MLSIPLVLAFVAAACAVSLVDAALRVAADSRVLIAATERAGVRAALVESSMELVGVRTPTVRLAIEGVLAVDWVNDTLRRCHAAVVQAARGLPPASVLELRGLKVELRRTLEELGQRAERACVTIVGEAECAPGQPARQEVEARFHEAQGGVDLVDDEVDVAALVSRDPAHARTVRVWLARAPYARWAGLGVLVALLALITLLNVVPLRRCVSAVGISLVLAAGVSMAAHAVAAGRVVEEIERRVPGEVARWGEGAGAEAALVRNMAPALTAFGGRLVHDVTAAARGPLLMGAIVGAALVLGGLAIRRRG